jgi:hypothetical protein
MLRKRSQIIQSFLKSLTIKTRYFTLFKLLIIAGTPPVGAVGEVACIYFYLATMSSMVTTPFG